MTNYFFPDEDMERRYREITLEDARKGTAYPVTIVKDRYGGVYSGAKWIAFNREVAPDKVGGSDMQEMEFWREDHEDYLIGKGATPDAAYHNLIENIIEKLS